MTGNLAASILARLLALAKQRGDDYNLLLNRFGTERLLARVSASSHADRFLLKGALLFALWYDTPHRPTKDVDLLGFGADDEAHLIAAFRDIAATFARREAALPTERPLALSRQFSEDAAKLRQWQAFLNKNRIAARTASQQPAWVTPWRCWTICCGQPRRSRPLALRQR